MAQEPCLWNRGAAIEGIGVMAGTGKPTRTMQIYLRLIYDLGQEGGEVTGSRLVEGLGVRHASVTNMLKKLAKMGLVWREPYHGVGLTAGGEREALAVIRRHRLIELYLVKALGYSWEQVHEEAEVLEHAVSSRFVERIDGALGYPEADAHGALIPTREGEVAHQDYEILAGIQAGRRVVLRRVLDTDPEILRCLEKAGLTPGKELEIVERHSFEGPLVLSDGVEEHIVGLRTARLVFVEPAPVHTVDEESP